MSCKVLAIKSLNLVNTAQLPMIRFVQRGVVNLLDN